MSKRKPKPIPEKQMPSRPLCAVSGKVGYRDIQDAKNGARTMHRSAISGGRVAESLYLYPCDDCQRFHLTRRSSWQGVELQNARTAPDLRLQQWARGAPRVGPATVAAAMQATQRTED